MTQTLHPNAGVGLRTPHLDFFSQNLICKLVRGSQRKLLLPHSSQRQQLREIRNHHHISCHGVGLSLVPLNESTNSNFTATQTLVDDIEPFLVSWSFELSQTGGHYFNDLLPLPYTEEALDVFCRNVIEVQDSLQRPMLIGEPSSYLLPSSIQRFQNGSFWLRYKSAPSVAYRSISIIFSSHRLIMALAVKSYLNGITPANQVEEIHLGRFYSKRSRAVRFDRQWTANPVCDEVAPYTQWIEQHGSLHLDWVGFRYSRATNSISRGG